MKTTKRKICLRLLSFILLIVLCLGFSTFAEEKAPTDEETIPPEEGTLNLSCKSAILMEATTGTILYLQNPDEALPPASVTKIMTLLLVMEAVDGGTLRLDDRITVSSNAASMGGSQVFLEEGEQLSLDEMLKCVVIASANDAAVALAEHVAGSVDAFVIRMNEKAKALGMKNTHFENVTGLDDTATTHLTSARDIAIMSRELLLHPTILQYSSIWMDSIRNGTFGLSNTNRLVRFYRGCTGLKTGSTSKAGFCVSATAQRDGLSLICVIMGAESGDKRTASATSLLDWGFANYALFTEEASSAGEIKVMGGNETACTLIKNEFKKVVPKQALKSIQKEIDLPSTLVAPLQAGDIVGTVRYIHDGKIIGTVPLCCENSVYRINFFEIFYRMLAKFLLI